MIIDLSLPLKPEMPGFPGYPGFEAEQLQEYGSDGKVSHHVSMNTHQGTHVDAPAHFIEDGQTVDDLSLDLLCGEVRVIDLYAYRGKAITANILKKEAPSLSADRVILVTGDVDYGFNDEDFFEEAAVLTSDAANWLLEQDVRLIANDFLTESIRNESRPVHHTLLGAGIPIVEYLCNTEAIADKRTLDFCCLPLRLSGLEAAPARVVVR